MAKNSKRVDRTGWNAMGEESFELIPKQIDLIYFSLRRGSDLNLLSGSIKDKE